MKLSGALLSFQNRCDKAWPLCRSDVSKFVWVAREGRADTVQGTDVLCVKLRESRVVSMRRGGGVTVSGEARS